MMDKKHTTTDKARLSTDSEGLGAWGNKIAGMWVTFQKRAKVRALKKEARELEIILDHYGAECNCCGQIRKLFLTVDEINNDRYLHRRGGQGGFKLYRQIINDGFPDDIQILCFNCKLGRQENGGICPHKERRPGCVD
jgi:DNA-directed RNA polymerase subunit N (RpoN/RPB10)